MVEGVGWRVWGVRYGMEGVGWVWSGVGCVVWSGGCVERRAQPHSRRCPLPPAQTLLPRQEVYHLPPLAATAAVLYLQQQEGAWLGQTVVARKDSDGFYYPGSPSSCVLCTGTQACYSAAHAGKVTRKLDKSQNFKIQWTNGSCQDQVYIYTAILAKSLYSPESSQESGHALCLSPQSLLSLLLPRISPTCLAPRLLAGH